MSSILSEDEREDRTEQTNDGGRDPVIRAVKMALTDADGRETGARDGRIVRPFLLVDLEAAITYLRGRRGTSGVTEALNQLATETELADPERERESGFIDIEPEPESGEGGGRGVLSKLFLVGVVVGLGYVLRKRSGSVGQTVSQMADRTRSVADETERRSGEMAGHTEAAAGEAADRIEQTGEAVADEAADRVREGGEMAADSMQETGEMAADEMEEAAEKTEAAEEKAEGAMESDEGEESEE